MALGLKDIHMESIVHRDIKHQNIFLSNQGTSPKVKIADFGLACYLEDDEFFRQKIGTLGYMSPEIIQGQPSDFRSDIWSLGVILYQLLCGEMPFLGSNRKELETKVLTMNLTYEGLIWSRVSEPCKDLLKHMLCKDTEQRYDIADVLLHPWLEDSF